MMAEESSRTRDRNSVTSIERARLRVILGAMDKMLCLSRQSPGAGGGAGSSIILH